MHIFFIVDTFFFYEYCAGFYCQNSVILGGRFAQGENFTKSLFRHVRECRYLRQHADGLFPTPEPDGSLPKEVVETRRSSLEMFTTVSAVIKTDFGENDHSRHSGWPLDERQIANDLILFMD